MSALLEAVDLVREEMARLNGALIETKAERDRARALAADLEGMVENYRSTLAEALQLMRWVVTPTTSHALEEQIGADVAAFLREHGEVAT